MDKHLTVEDYELYLKENDFSEEYLIQFDSINEHLFKCQACQRRLEIILNNDYLFTEEGMAAGLELLKHEEEIRRKYVLEKIIAQGGVEAKVVSSLVKGVFTMRKCMRNEIAAYVPVLRGDTSEAVESRNDFEVFLDDGRIGVSVQDKENVTVIVMANDKVLTNKAGWDEKRECMVAYFDTDGIGDEYYVYVIND